MNFDSEDSRFYKNDENENLICEITYSIADSSLIVIDRTFVDDDYRGQGIAAQLVDRVVEMAREENKKIIPRCPYAKGMLERKSSLYADVMS
ncbi:GNAT family N-acetyltransferase [uncultured Trichococcus sp.]|uniref:GNAT family N-acetyltransferase n=1 Tax=uncultured Trichococcus sp. TaxID=189665 RepID=UPI0029C76E22|nr:GNAT family N-acetyltransferase [uncultured Trichococcus sp.]